jgi:hypothetical protein
MVRVGASLEESGLVLYVNGRHFVFNGEFTPWLCIAVTYDQINLEWSDAK